MIHHAGIMNPGEATFADLLQHHSFFFSSRNQVFNAMCRTYFEDPGSYLGTPDHIRRSVAFFKQPDGNIYPLAYMQKFFHLREQFSSMP